MKKGYVGRKDTTQTMILVKDPQDLALTQMVTRDFSLQSLFILVSRYNSSQVATMVTRYLYYVL